MTTSFYFKIVVLFMVFIVSKSLGQTTPGQTLLDLELKHRVGKIDKVEKYYKNGQLDSVYRQWNHKDQKLTEGYYVQGKRHGKWYEWISSFQAHNYLLYTYEQGVLKKLYVYMGWPKQQDSIKASESTYIFESDVWNYTEHTILWNRKMNEKKKNETIRIIRDCTTVHTKIKRWRSSGSEWETEEEKNLYDENGKNLGAKKHGTWRLWNKDGTLQKETWYDMGQKLREKLYDHGKLTSDKKY